MLACIPKRFTHFLSQILSPDAAASLVDEARDPGAHTGEERGVVESRVRRGRTAGLEFGSASRNDLRRERKLPGFFDREVYDILDGGDCEELTTRLALALDPSVEAGAEDPEVETLFDSGRSEAVEDGLFFDFEPSGRRLDFPVPLRHQPTPVIMIWTSVSNDITIHPTVDLCDRISRRRAANGENLQIPMQHVGVLGEIVLNSMQKTGGVMLPGDVNSPLYHVGRTLVLS
ncbi:unnamed protein product [Cuscuta campestris]|uniref:Uncharacterized protein n=1 Tax=Cuscuta campestris TaxID=132261 RepID=A0A484MJQ5_9ASTE|nr:unnamed protein product [Cuscuta campestris]